MSQQESTAISLPETTDSYQRQHSRLHPNEAALTQEYLREALDYDPATGDLTWRTRPRPHFKSLHAMGCFNTQFAGKVAGSINGDGYIQVSICGKDCKAHRLIWMRQTGEWPLQEIDHVNGQRADNRFTNLRCVNRQENLRNQKIRSDNTSGVLGVSYDKRDKKWRAKIMVGGRDKHLGMFTNKEDAIAARKAAEAEHGFHANHGRAA